MEHFGAHTLVDRCVRELPDKAVDILVRASSQDERIYNEILTYFIQPSRNAQLGPSRGFNMIIGSPTQTSPPDLQHSGSPPPHQTLPQRPPSSARSSESLGLSNDLGWASRTASPVPSHSSKAEANSREYILLLTFSESQNHVEQKVARMEIAPIKHSVMREDVVRKRNLISSLTPIDEFVVFVPHPTGPGPQRQVSVSHCATLEWRRPHSQATHSTTFYIVPNDILDIDIVLGYEDYGPTSAYHATFAQQPQHSQGYILEGYPHSMRPPAPSPPAPSYHRSTSASATPIQHTNQFLESLVVRQQAHAANVETSRLSHHLSQHSPANTVFASVTPHIEHPQPLRPSTTPIVAGHNVDQNITTDKIRLNLIWEVTPMNMWLDMRADCETFFEAFKQLVTGRKGIFERSTTTILLKKEKATPDAEGCLLSLDIEALEADWETTVEWIQNNRRTKPPHIYGRIQAIEGERVN